MRRILGLDLGTNSIGWATIRAEEQTLDNKTINYQPIGIEAAGSRIIPMDAAILGDFDKGNSISQTAERTQYRSSRRLRERFLLRRERLHRVLRVMGFLPEHYDSSIDQYGKFLNNLEPKLAWRKDELGQSVFLFQNSFNEMLADFEQNQPTILPSGQKVPYDWTIYYLRKKALTQAITKEELAWILLNFNQKRGYYQLRGEDEEEDTSKRVEYFALKVVSVEDSGEKKGKDIWYNIHLENGWIYRRTSSVPLDWVGKTKEFIVTTEYNEDGTPKKDKDGIVKRSFRSPKEDDWTLLKKKTEFDITQSGKTVGQFIYDSLLSNPQQKINGKLVRTIERKFYRSELEAILNKQQSFIPELLNRDLLQACLMELYPHNEAHRNNISNKDFRYFFINDILYYQRPLKSKKSLISDCPYEELTYIDKKTGETRHSPIKCIAKSQPLFQEFRLWQFLDNLRIYERNKEINGKLLTDVDVTFEWLKTEEDYVSLFNWLNDRKEITQDSLLGSYFKIKKPKGKESVYPYRWNYVEDKTYPCNETRALLLSRLDKAGIQKEFLNKVNEESLWHILYSVEDKIEIDKALKSFASKLNLGKAFVEAFRKCPPFKKEYGAYSAKAIKKMLPLMRRGVYWNVDAIDQQTRLRIDKLLTGEFDETIQNRVREKAINLSDIIQFKGLPLWLVCYIVYGRHSETKEITKWESPADIDNYLKSFKQHSLRNPIVEQVITETLRTVRDIWLEYGQIDEIHLELGREMKNPADKRAKMTQQIIENENANLRIKALLQEFLNPEYGIDNVRPYSPSQQDLLRIYEDGVFSSVEDIPEDVEAIISKFKETDINKRPTHSEFMRYKLWLEQFYRSPYTGNIIPLGKLFTPAYEIEHIIPQSRYFDDSFSNKVICESEVNKLKDNLLGYEFIKAHHGEKLNDRITILTVEAYEKLVNDCYSRSRTKMKKLLLEDIPEQFIERQLNDSRYISKVVKSLLSNIVRERDEKGEFEMEATSKNLISCTGGITDRLKKDWGMNDVWNRIILPRFQRLNKLTESSQFTVLNSEGDEIPSMPLELQKGFNKKRIDHRHHAMDAIVIACATRDHVNLLNNEAAKPKNQANRYHLSHKLRRYEKTIICGEERSVPKEFLKPWDTFTQDTYRVLCEIIVSFKQNLRIINATSNRYQHFEGDKKVFVKQNTGVSWAIRKPMHKDTVFAKVNLRKIKEVSLNNALSNPKNIVEKELKLKIISLLNLGLNPKQIMSYFNENKDVWSDVNLNKVKVYYFTDETNDSYFATRKAIDTSLNRKKIEEGITDTGIQKILLRHLSNHEEKPELAFSPDGIEEMNQNIIALNDGKYHQPIYKVRLCEKADKFPIGIKGNKSKKYVEAAKGTNLFFAVYEYTKTDKRGEQITSRSFASVPLKIVIECQKIAGKKWKGHLDNVLKENKLIENDSRLLFILSPNDLVYLPTKDQLKNGINAIDYQRIYKFVSCTGRRLYCIPYFVSNSIADKKEYSQLNKVEFSDDNTSIKEICIPLIVNRLGCIISMGY